MNVLTGTIDMKVPSFSAITSPVNMPYPPAILQAMDRAQYFKLLFDWEAEQMQADMLGNGFYTNIPPDVFFQRLSFGPPAPSGAARPLAASSSEGPSDEEKSIGKGLAWGAAGAAGYILCALGGPLTILQCAVVLGILAYTASRTADGIDALPGDSPQVTPPEGAPDGGSEDASASVPLDGGTPLDGGDPQTLDPEGLCIDPDGTAQSQKAQACMLPPN